MGGRDARQTASGTLALQAETVRYAAVNKIGSPFVTTNVCS